MPLISCGIRLPHGCTQSALFCVRVYSFVNHPPKGSHPLKVVVVNTALNNLSPSLLCVFTQYLHSYGLVRLPFHAFFSRYPETDIPCSVLKPNFKSCRLCNGGHIASKQVSRYACLCILRTMRFCPTTYAISLLLQRFICIHLLKSYLMDFFPHLFSIRSLQRLCSFCSVERFGNHTCMALPILRNG